MGFIGIILPFKFLKKFEGFNLEGPLLQKIEVQGGGKAVRNQMGTDTQTSHFA
jgi:hypothetical protein